MFTGLVQAKGTLDDLKPSAAGVRLVVQPIGWRHVPSLGDSISISGVCLTVADQIVPDRAPATDAKIAFDVIPETLAKTKLGRLALGDEVNMEHSLTPTTLMGGHFVQGHVDGVGEVVSIKTSGEWRVTIRPPSDVLAFMSPKGSVCVDGVSLTLASIDVAAGTFDIALIPTTLALTTLRDLQVGDQVNLEADMIAKTIVNYLKHWGGIHNAARP